MRRVILLAVVALLALTTAPATAGTLDFSGAPQFTAATGETNHLVVSFDGAAYTIQDSNPIRLGYGGCTLVDAHTATCPIDPAAILSPAVRLGDGDDTFEWRGAGLPTGEDGPKPNIEGGDGNDVLRGGPSSEFIFGGPGADSIDAGAGDDHIGAGDDALTDVLGGGPGKDIVSTGPSDSATGGPDRDFINVAAGSRIDARDGGVDDFECQGTPASILLDVRTVANFPDGQDALNCTPPGSLGKLQLVTKQRTFKISRRTRKISLTFACPASTGIVCESGGDGADLGNGNPCRCWVTKPFRILPGQRLKLTATINRDDLGDIYDDLGRRNLKGLISWRSSGDPQQGEGVFPHAVKVKFVDAARRRR